MKKLLLSIGLIASACLQLRAQVGVTASGGTPSGSYTTLSAAFAAINAGTHQGNITIAISGNTTEPASTVALLKSASPSSYSSIYIMPAGGDWTINSAASPTASRGVIELSGADNVTIDGDPGLSGLRHLSIVVATNTNTGTAAVRFSSNSTTGTDGADNNVIKNCIITGGRSSATTTTVSYGVNMSNYSSTSMTTGAYSSLNTIIQNNLITRCYHGVYANGSSGFTITGTQILDNIIGSATSANNIGGRGIFLAYTNTAVAGNAMVTNNDIRVGDYTTSGGYAATIAGIEVSAGNTGVVIDRNNIHDINQPSTGGYGAHGIYVTSATSNTGFVITNNFIRDCKMYVYQTLASNAFIPTGVFFSSAATGVVFNNNTVVMNSQLATSTTFSSFCVNAYASATTFAQFQNNILINNLASSGAYGFYTGATTVISAATVNNNDYYTPGGNIGYYNGTAYTTLATWQTATGKDGSSFNTNIPFTSATNLHVPAGTATLLESAGSVSAGVMFDIDNDMRPGPAGSVYGGGNAPDIGADEFDGAILAANDIAVTAFVSPVSGGSMGSSVNITPQASFANNGTATQTNIPVRYQILNSSNTLVYNQTTTIASLTPGATTTVTFPAGSVPSNGTYTIRAIAQLAGDQIATNDSITGTVTALTALCGTYHIGAGQAAPFNTLTAAVNQLNIVGASCAVTFILDSATYSTAETFPITINSFGGASAVNTLTIKPNTGATVSITGNTTSALLKLNGAKYVIIDGSNSGGTDRSLTFNNTGTTSPAGIWVSSTGTGAGATNDVIKNCNVTVGANSASGYGIALCGTTLLSSGADNDNITIQNNAVTNAAVGIYAYGTASVTSGGLDNITITGNTITTSTTAAPYGIELGNCLNSTVSQNTINIATSTSTQPVGISLETGFVSSVVRRNLITGVVTTATGGYGGRGITIATGVTSSNLTVDNNMIYGVNGSNYTGFTNSSSMGICIGAIGNSGTLTTVTGGINLYYNSVNMYGSYTYAANCLTAALYVGSGATGLDIRNNVFTNSLNNSSSSGTASRNYTIYSDAAIAAFTTINNNVYYTPGTQGVLGYIGSDRTTIVNMQAGFGGNTNSFNTNPAFTSNTNLHIPAATLSQLESTGAAIAGFNSDYDGDARPGPAGSVNGGGSVSDIGADEFDGVPAPTADIAATAFITPVSGAVVAAAVNFTPQASFTNNGIAAQTNIPVRYRIINSSNVEVYNQTATIASLGIGLTTTVSFPVGAFPATGSYTIRAIAQLATDQLHTNDSISGTVSAAVPFCGTYHIGTAQAAPFNTITNAVNQLNAVGATCAVTFLLDDASYTTAETFPITINQLGGISASSLLTIKPNAGATVSISGSSATSLLKLNGADYVVLDGSNNGTNSRNLTITNTSTTTSGNAAIWIAAPATGNGATFNTVKNCIIEGNAATTTFLGMYVGGSTSISLTASGNEQNNNNVISNNLFRKTQYGLAMFGYAAATPDSNNQVLNNNFGTTVAGEGFSIEGLHTDRQNAIIVAGNDVQNVKGTSGTTMYGIRLLDFKNGKAYNNKVHNMAYSGASTTKLYGIAVASSTYTTVTAPSNGAIYNNMVYDLTSNGISTTWNTTGILASSGYGDKFYYNSVSLTGQINNSTGGYCAAFANGDENNTTPGNNIDVRNNIFSITGSGGGGSIWAYYSKATTLTGTVQNNNDFVCASTGGATNYLFRYNSTNYSTLAAWQAATSADLASVNATAPFVSATDLHIAAGTATLLESAGAALTGFATDIDGDSRPGPAGSVNGGGTAPDLGADEFDGIPASPNDIAATAFVSPVNGASVASVNSFTPQATFTNTGSVAQTNIPVRYKIINSSNVVVYNQTSTIASLAVGAVSTVTFPSGTIPTAGSYTIRAIAQLATDQQHNNDSISGTVTAFAPLCGTYHVGASQAAPYNTLTGAVNQLNLLGATCAVTFLLDDASYTTAETFPITLNPVTGINAASPLTIKPNAGATVSISGSSATSLLKLNGADYVMLDGSNNGTNSRNLTITNTSTTTSGNAAIWIAAPATGNGATYNTVKNCIIEGNAATTTFLGMYVGGSTSISLTAAGNEQNNNNVISNNLFRKTQYGLAMFGYAAATPDSNNQVLNNNFGTTVAGEGFSIEGLHTDRQNAIIVAGNDVQNVKGTSGTTMYGIRLLDFKNGKAYSNKVHSLAYSGTSTTKLYGIAVASSTYTTVTAPSNGAIYNNMVYDLTSTATSTTWNTTGILASSGYGDKFYFNTVSLAGQINNSTGGYCAAFANGDENNTTPGNNIDVRNNIFNITGSGGGGSVWAYYSKATTFTGTVQDYNDFNCTSTGGGVTNYLFRFNGTNYSTLAAWQTANNADLSSANVIPPFVSATDAHITAGVPTVLESAGFTIAGFATDIDGDSRPGPAGSVNGGGTAPDLGADEFDGIPAVNNDIAATSFVVPLSGSTVAVNGSFTPQATFTNAGLQTQTNVPVRYKIINSSNVVVYNQTATIASVAPGAAATATFPAGTITAAGNYTIRIKAELTTDQQHVNDSISGTLTASAALCGTYHVGTSQPVPFNSLTSAVSALNAAGVSCPVTFLLDDASYSAAETFPIVINAVPGASAANTVLIRPNTGTVTAITGSSTAALIKLNSASFVTIDGSNSGGTDKSLTINNNNGGSPSGIWLASAGTAAGAANNTIKNCNITVTPNTATSYGIVLSGSTIGAAGADNDAVTLQNNAITNASIGIFANGTASVSAGGLDNLVVSGNSITTSTTATSFTGGIELGNALNSTVLKNTISIQTASTTLVGISLENGFVNSVVRKNVITSVLTTATGGYGGRGITVGTNTATSNLTIDHNMISGINGSNYSSFTNSSAMGICIGTVGGSTTLTTVAGGINLYYNSINMYGDYSYAASCLTAALYIGTGATALDVRNNIFSNSMNNTNASGTGSKNYAVYNTATSSVFTAIDYNDYYTSGIQGVPAYLSGDKTSIADIRVAFGGTIASVMAAPSFVSSTDLHIDPTTAGSWLVNGRGIAISGYSTDIDENSRSITVGTPVDLGADEFNTTTTPDNAIASAAPAQGTTTVYRSGNRKVAEITWGATGTVPTAVAFKYYPGVAPGNGLVASTAINSYADVQFTGGTGYTYTMKMYYTDAEANAIPDASLKVIKKTGAVAFLSYASTVGTDTAGKFVTAAGFPNTGLFSLGTNAVPLAVKLLSFNGTNKGTANYLYWNTATENTGDRIVLERSKDGKEFADLASFTAKGKSSSYDFTDEKPFAGLNHYRLALYGADGSLTYSTTVTLYTKNAGNFAISASPNPVADKTVLKVFGEVGENAVIRIIDISGKIIQQTQVTGTETIINMSELPSGVYLINYADSQNSSTIRVSK